MSELRDAFIDTAALVLAAIGRDEVARAWPEPSVLEGMTVGGLAAHLARAVTMVESYLDKGLGEGEPMDAVSYYASIEGLDVQGSDVNLAVLERAQSGAEDGPAAVVERFSTSLAAMRDRLDSEPADRRLAVLGGRPMLLDQYLLTRIVEMVLHLDDLAMSVEPEAGSAPLPEASPAALQLSIGMLVGVACARSGELGVLRALARRERVEGSPLQVI